MVNGQGDLKHYGIKGMRWGIRKDRSASRSADSVAAKKLKRKRIEEMSNTELAQLNKRLQLERQYKDLTKKDTNPGLKFVSNVLQESGKNLATKYTQQAGEIAIAQVGKVVSTKWNERKEKQKIQTFPPFRSTTGYSTGPGR